MGTKEEFKNIKDINDLALFLNVNVQELNFLLYARNQNNYTYFKIPKKDGNYREIYSPKRQLKYIQRKLLDVFYGFYNDNSNVYGFLKNKSIVDNSKKHIGKKCVINIDLKDFFPSITFYRINGLLQKSPFNFKRDISIIIANLLTYNNFLPQGAPTSPLLSNFICRSLDRELSKYAKIHDAIYTRYADDITFSVNNNNAVKYFIDEIDEVSVNSTLEDIIKRNGFQVNEKKVRKSYIESHQEVTGIVVNEKPNINQNYYYRLRSMIHAWEKFGLEDAAKEHCKKINTTYTESAQNYYKSKVIGMLNYFKMVCGANDSRYIRLATKVNMLCNHDQLLIDYDLQSLTDCSVYLIGDFVNKNFCTKWGTAFKVKDYFITCRHCVIEQGCKQTDDTTAYIFNINNDIGMEIEILYTSYKNDFLIFKVPNLYKPQYFHANKNEINVGQKVKIVGFPDYVVGDHISRIEASITNDIKLPDENDICWVVDRQIQPGLSGGPVLDESNNVIGMIVYGCTNIDDGETKNGFLSINTIINEYNNRNKN